MRLRAVASRQIQGRFPVRALLVLTVVTLVTVPVAAEAQFTTVVAPPRAKEVAQSAASADSARAHADSLMRVRLGDMREWVDSAAVAIAGVSDTMRVEAVDSGVVAREPERVEPRPTTEFREGALAPATATGLPTLALIGIGMLGIGAILIGRPRA
jgi:hypothetical protein